jgi:transposase InsO family protein
MGTVKLLHKLQIMLGEHQIKMGRDKLFDLLRSHGMLVRCRKRRIQTTFSRHHYRKYPNLIVGLIPNKANQLWVSDITYLRLAKDFAYLSVVVDAYSRKIVGWSLYPSLHTEGCLRAFSMALSQLEGGAQGLIHHSDRGSQYCSDAYTALLKKHKIRISMTEHSDPRENAKAERLIGILKEEYLPEKAFTSFTQAQDWAFRTVGIYNIDRPHMSCDMLTPEQAHLHIGSLRQLWKNYYQWKMTQQDPTHEKSKEKKDRRKAMAAWLCLGAAAANAIRLPPKTWRGKLQADTCKPMSGL